MTKNKNNNTAAIILAAGGSRRFGRPKQLLDWFGKTFVEKIAETAIGAGLWPVIVVTGCEHDQIQVILRDIDAVVVYNEKWDSGQSSSLKIGIKKLLEYGNNKFIFLLVDMPQVTVKWLLNIQEKAEDEEYDIVTTTVNGEVSPPILFKKSCYARLEELEGDSGGKKLVKEFKTKFIECEDKGMSIDCDTEEDYRALLKIFN